MSNIYEDYDDGYSIAGHILAELRTLDDAHPVERGLTSAELAVLVEDATDGSRMASRLRSMRERQLVVKRDVTPLVALWFAA